MSARADGSGPRFSTNPLAGSGGVAAVELGETPAAELVEAVDRGPVGATQQFVITVLPDDAESFCGQSIQFLS